MPMPLLLLAAGMGFDCAARDMLLRRMRESEYLSKSAVLSRAGRMRARQQARVSEGPSVLKSLGGGENLEVGIIREIPRKSNTTTLAKHYIVIPLAAYQTHHRI